MSRAAIEAAGPSATAEAIRAAVAACDYDRAAVLAFARARRGETVEVADIAAILPGLELWSIACALIAIAQGDRIQLLELLERRRFPRRIDSGELEAIALYAAWRAGAARDRLIPETRRLSVRQMTVEGFALVATVGAALDDANVATAIKHLTANAKEHTAGIAETDRTLARTLDQAIAALPAEVEIPDGGGFTVRAAKQVGRNDPCPCGSGQKFKRCCADKPVKSGSPIAGVSWDEFLSTSADRMTAEHVDELALVDLARVELTRLQRDAMMAAFDAFCAAHEWEHAERAIAERGEPCGPRASARGQHARQARVRVRPARRGRARARPHRPAVRGRTGRCSRSTSRVTTPSCGARSRAGARDVTDKNDRERLVDLAYGLLRRSPRLGIVLARAYVGSGELAEADVLLEAVEDARDRLNLPPGDPAWDVLDALGKRRGGRGRGADSAEAEQLRESLTVSAARADELERSLAATRAALDAARVPAVAELARAHDKPEPDRARGLETKVRELEAMIRDGNAERRELAAPAPDHVRAARRHHQAPRRPRRRAPARTRPATTPTTRSARRSSRPHARSRSPASTAVRPTRSARCRRRSRPRRCGRSARSPPATSRRGAGSSRPRTWRVRC